MSKNGVGGVARTLGTLSGAEKEGSEQSCSERAEVRG